MSELETLRAALREELSCLWTDLQTARRDAVNGQWSMHCDWIEGRIKTITPLVGPTPWTELDIQLIEDGVYQRVHAEIGVDAPYDEDGVRKHRARLNASAGPVRPDEEPTT
ncbi:hypothetical protein [Streptomyces scabiei]|uniref:hypothetical protein n=1 Tax=Streptomyces scabiei TaxID=1930 RepID=UPI001B3071E1|nr:MULTISPECIES: hypothetical protein [Streptomyces]MBP5870870.1 hypothetical protein [Streptomyces sp. LBUM 1485]MBP5913226.1 hypothetical protein [Streptomyces sp. LBUM 1486]MDX2532305.1 hypothetical protein [Streptomyces scabiei]MDX2794611.1 hypothetical protein [Streptomyces scabiei]MDX3822387.1 hypothetical protein [Streptomyces scabiei]